MHTYQVSTPSNNIATGSNIFIHYTFSIHLVGREGGSGPLGLPPGHSPWLIAVVDHLLKPYTLAPFLFLIGFFLFVYLCRTLATGCVSLIWCLMMISSSTPGYWWGGRDGGLDVYFHAGHRHGGGGCWCWWVSGVKVLWYTKPGQSA